MRNVLVYFGLFAVFALFFTSCGETTFDESLLIGKWKDETRNLLYIYSPNHSGVSWNPDEDIDVEAGEGLRFDWSLNGAELEHNYHSVMIGGPLVTRIFTVTVLNSTTLRYRDDFGRTFSFTKVPE